MLSATVQGLASAPYHFEPLQAADAFGQVGVRGQGPYMYLWLKLDGAIIVSAYFQTYSCPVSIACGSWIAKWLEGRNIHDVSVIDAADLERVLGGVPLGREHCAARAVECLRNVAAKACQHAQAGGIPE